MTQTAEAHGCSVEIRWRQPPYPPTVNDETVSLEVARLAEELVGDKWLRLENPSMGGEDFSFLARKSSTTILAADSDSLKIVKLKFNKCCWV